MFTKCLDIFSSILTLIKKCIDYKEKQDENTFRTKLNSDPASIWLSKFGGKDRRNQTSDTTTDVKEHNNN